MRWLRDINVGNRSKRAAYTAPFKRAHYRALAGMVRVYPDLRENLVRYLQASGEYPYECRVRTPLGKRTPRLYSSHDISTVTEVFCREDYRCGADVRVVVDIGSNIGISALYFLTRNSNCRAYLFEPDPRNVRRLRANLADFEDRFVLDEAAIAVSDGLVSFGTEPSGRYGRISDSFGETITVRARAINAALRDVLRQKDGIDVLKIDTEGIEPELVAALAVDVLEHIDVIYFEASKPHKLHPRLFSHTNELHINRLTRRAAHMRT